MRGSGKGHLVPLVTPLVTMTLAVISIRVIRNCLKKVTLVV